MNRSQARVKQFMEAIGQDAPNSPVIPARQICQLRLKLIQEELDELRDAFDAGDRLAAYDAILDLLYVVYGTAVACGMDTEPGEEEVHRSNMSKVKDGYRRDDGKWVKGPSYVPPDLEQWLKAKTIEIGSPAQ